MRFYTYLCVLYVLKVYDKVDNEFYIRIKWNSKKVRNLKKIFFFFLITSAFICKNLIL